VNRTLWYELRPKDDRLVMALGEHGRFNYRLKYERGRVTEWPDLRWSSDEAVPRDWPWPVDSFRLVSPRVREVFEENGGPRDDIQWIPGMVVTNDGVEHPYWVPHFPTWHDVLDEDETTWGPSGLPMRWVLSCGKLDGLSVFIVPGLRDLVIVSPAVLEDLQRIGATGYKAEPARRV